MPLPDIDFSKIRLHNGTQANAFEELCCQLANDEDVGARARFDRKGPGGDGGIECFATLDDGSEIGWQVKFYSNFDSMLASLDGSLTQALEKHPGMRRFIACMPFDLADSRRSEVKTALSKWDAWKEKRIALAAQGHRAIEIERWDAHALKSRLTSSHPRAGGRIAFWFDKELLTQEWFRAAFDRTADSLGERYSPQSHIDIPIRQTILASLRDPSIFETLASLARTIQVHLAASVWRADPAPALADPDPEYSGSDNSQAAEPTPGAAGTSTGQGTVEAATTGADGGGAGDGGIAGAVADSSANDSVGDSGGAHAAAVAVTAVLTRLSVERPEPFPRDQVVEAVDRALDLAIAWNRRLRARRSTHSISAPDAAVSRLVSSLRATAGVIRSVHWRFLDQRSMLVVGDAGTGKSHLLADACEHQIAAGRPALMVLGGKLPDAEPWGEILRDLDLPRDLRVRQFLGALNAAGEADGVRCLVAIDALNEKNGQAIWPERLAGFLRNIADFPWITVVLSCRTTYEEIVVPDVLGESRLPRVLHEGFNDEEVVFYLARRGISVPETPRQLDELTNPLFLRLTCDALGLEGAALVPRELGGISDILQLFEKGVTRRVEASLEAAPRRNLVGKAIAALASEMAATGRGEIGFDRADQLIREIHDDDRTSRDLLFQLENEGLLLVESDRYSQPGSAHIVRFTFERHGDHAVAAWLLKDEGGPGACGATNAAQTGRATALSNALNDETSRIVPGLLEALAIQLPEKLGVELPDHDALPYHFLIEPAFEQSLLTRRASAFSARTWELVCEQGSDELRLETLIALSSEPGHDFNVLALDAELRALAMPERDALWSIHLVESQRAMSLVEWVWNADQARIGETRAELAGRQLAWFFTTTRRPLRDRATKALVMLLADRPALAARLWSDFRTLDDLYVVERMLAALLGAALQGRWTTTDLAGVAAAVYDDLFVRGDPPANALLRDHAVGLVAVATRCGALDHGAIAKAAGPHRSAWPIEHVSDDVIDGYMRAYGDAGRFPDEIVESCKDGDFGRYVLDSAVRDWSMSTLGTSPLPTANDMRNAWFRDFTARATPPMIQAHDAMMAVIEREGQSAAFGPGRDSVRAVKAAFRAAVGSDEFEEWREKAEYWRADGMYQRIAGKGAAELNLGWARRWVIKRAHDLGWSEALHGDFDRSVRSERGSHRIERIGKKYQWLALYELVGRLLDNVEPLPGQAYDRLHLRNIDPSLLVTNALDDALDGGEGHGYWTGSRASGRNLTLDARA
ncbi:AAA ATPase [Sphingomonas sp. LH128]|uniref:hypothetical protein n=1 Tax=Sphingomonas sp. LH128 TaxID=473781 RepID=UPI00027CB826|nr:hypothetical protein [Sphingomonas sp. LH128]EJU15112.1 AAA ATPase [Sphingomonas sp. LH128]